MKKNIFDFGRYPVVVLCLFIFCSHILYVLKTHQYPQWDEHNYLSLAIKYYDIFRTPTWDIYPRMLAQTGYLQPMYSFFISLLLLIFGTSHTYAIALIFNGIFFMAATFGVYTLARESFDSTTGIVAAIVFSCLGNVLFYSHFAYTETAVTTFIVWSLVYLNRSNILRSGLLFALAVLTRWIAIIFLIGPAIRMRKNIPFFVLLAFGIPIVLYFLPNWNEFFNYVQRNQSEGAAWVAQYRFAEMADTFSTHSVMYYFNILSQNTIGIFLAFVLGFLFCLRNIKKTWLLLLAFLVPYIFLTFVAVWKEDRFLVPLYPVFAIITASIVFYIRNKTRKIIVLLFLVTLSLLNAMGASWGIGPMGKRGLTDIVLPSFIRHPRRIYLTPLVWPPTKEYLNAHLIAREIQKSHRGATVPIVVGAFTSEPLDNALQSIVRYHERSLMQYKKPPFDMALSDFVLTKSNDTQITDLANHELIAQVPIPMDNSVVSVYKYEKE